MSIQTYIDRIGPIPPEALVVCLGVSPPPACRALVFTEYGPPDLARIQSVGPQEMKGGLVFIINSSTYRQHKAFVDFIQRHLSWLYCKFVHYPSFLNIPDPCGLHGPKPPNIPNEINRNRNMPLLLRAPLTDSLALANIRLPLLLVLPGPSLDRLAPQVKDLSRVCLVACLSRTLSFCLEHGVEPDFLVQLDTAWRQTYFLPAGPALPHCTLVALSLAPIHDLMQRFRGVFFMDSFDPEILPNPARLRESWLSSLFPCLGLAEALASPLVLVAGADLSFSSAGQYHGQATQSGDSATLYPSGKPPEVVLGNFTVPDIHGRTTTTNLNYFASAYEASLFAQQIAKTTGARFRNATGTGILDPEWYPLLRDVELAALRPIDRKAFLHKMDTALTRPSSVQLEKLEAKLFQTETMVQSHLNFLNFCRWRKQEGEAAAYQAVQSLHLLGDYLTSARDLSPGGRLDLTIRLMEQWAESLDVARNACQLEQERNRHGQVPVMCLDGEDALTAAVRSYPGIQPRTMRLWTETTPPPQDGSWVEYSQFAAWSMGQKVFLVTYGAARRFRQLLTSMPRRNWVML
jgi:hypothetical protein